MILHVPYVIGIEGKLPDYSRNIAFLSNNVLLFPATIRQPKDLKITQMMEDSGKIQKRARE